MTDQHAAIAARIADVERRMRNFPTNDPAMYGLAHARKEWSHNLPACDAVASRDLDRCDFYLRQLEGSKP